MTRSVSIPAPSTRGRQAADAGNVRRRRPTRLPLLAVAIVAGGFLFLVAAVAAVTLLAADPATSGDGLRTGASRLGIVEAVLVVAFVLLGAGLLVDLRRTAPNR